MDIASVLKSLRTESGLTQKELSARIDIAQATIACYENGQRLPCISSLAAYADFFNCSVDYIIGRDDEYGNRVRGAAESVPVDRLSDDERDFVIKYRKLTKEQRAILLGYIDGLNQKIKAN